MGLGEGRIDGFDDDVPHLIVIIAAFFVSSSMLLSISTHSLNFNSICFTSLFDRTDPYKLQKTPSKME